MMLGYQTTTSKMTLACAADHSIETDNVYTQRSEAGEDMAKIVYRVQAKPGQTIKLSKAVVYHTSRGVPVKELSDRCRRTLDRVAESGIEQQFGDQRAWMDAYWARCDVEIPGQPEVQQAVRWNLFQLAQAAGRAEGMGIPAKGVTGSGYGGHYFWDTEVYVMPFLTYTSPMLARNALRFRYGMLPAAVRRAKDLQQDGALFPWRTINGEEASAYYAAGTAQYHIDADISYALSKYVDATGDEEFLDARSDRHPRADGSDVGRSRLLGLQRRRVLPHPRCDRPRRVHDRGQRQPLHQRDGALQPAPRRGVGRVSPGVGARCLSTGWWPG